MLVLTDLVVFAVRVEDDSLLPLQAASLQGPGLPGLSGSRPVNLYGVSSLYILPLNLVHILLPSNCNAKKNQ